MSESAGKKAELADIGVNLNSKQYRGKHDEVIKQTGEAGVTKMITISNSIKDFELNLAFCRKYKQPVEVRCTLGVHPHNAKELEHEGNFSLLRGLVTGVGFRNLVVAIGECGLDYNRMFSPMDIQKKWFELQIQLALDVGLPLYFHERDAFDDFYQIVSRYDLSGKAVVHCFTGSPKELQAYLGLGLYIGITGWICDERRSEELQKAVPLIPLDRILLETDSPWLTPRTISPRPKYNEPKYLSAVVGKVAELMKVEVEVLIKAADQNRFNLFGF